MLLKVLIMVTSASPTWILRHHFFSCFWKLLLAKVTVRISYNYWNIWIAVNGFRSSQLEVLFEISQNLLEHTGASLLFSEVRRHKVAVWPCNFINKETPSQVFSCEFCEISKNTFLYRTHAVAASVDCLNDASRFNKS